MNIVCLDLEGVLFPEIWIEFSKRTKIKELSRTTKDEPNYDKLMKMRLDILNEKGFGMKEISEVISEIEPYDGAKTFLDELRKKTEVIILSDTFRQFSRLFIDKLNKPTIFCHEFIVSDTGIIEGYKLRENGSKREVVKALKQVGFEVISAGDSYNDLGMIRESKKGFLFKAPDKIKNENRDIETVEDYETLLNKIEKYIE